MADALTLVMPLRKKEAMSVADFRRYWLDVHVTLPARYPGLRSVFLHLVSFPDSRWPAVDGVSAAPAEADEFHGVPEATFAAMDDLATFQAASHYQMVDGVNFLSEMLAYPSVGTHSETLVDTTDPVPDGHDGLLRHLVFLRRRPDVDVATFRAWVADDLAPALAAHASKVRRHLLEEIEVSLDHPGTVMSKPLDRQYQACVEVAFPDAAALDALVASDAWVKIADGVREHCAAVHAPLVERCIATRHDGHITLAGLRGVTVADLITQLHAENQMNPAVSRIFVQDDGLLPA
ncbi:EthD domain-containing protein [Actinomycetospora flava]|uniref:EthD domain-containing protein n=1 Tax=Actinomycetospora flava TaxID=3129232 RepID=A0ABU8LZS2_9PSEU